MNYEDERYIKLDSNIDKDLEKFSIKNNIKYIMDFDRNSKVNGKLIGTTATNKQRLMYFFKYFITKDWAKVTRKDIEDVMLQLNNKQWGEKTKSNYKKIIKQFDKQFNGGEVCSDRTRWIKASPQKRKLNNLQRSDLLTAAEKKKLIQATDNIRDKAIISLWLETGMRPKELRTLTIGSVTMDRQLAYIQVASDTKTGTRPIPIYFSKKVLLDYLEEHPAKNDSKAALWYNTRKNKIMPISDGGFESILKKVTERSGVKKRIYWYLGRHQSYTDKSAMGWNEAITKQFHGIAPNSSVLDRYIHMSGEDVKNKIMEHYGLRKTTATAPDLVIKKCLNCGEEQQNSNIRCSECGYIIDEQEMFKELEKKQNVEKELTELKQQMANIPQMIQELMKENLLDLKKALEIKK